MVLTVIILAAGKGTRMKSENPKVLFQAAGRAMIDYTLDLSESLNPDKIVVVTGSSSELVEKHLENRDVIFAAQKEQKGTAHAVMSAIDYIPDEGKTLILCGDMPLIKRETVEKFINGVTADISFISVNMTEPFGYGRVVRSASKSVLKIVEEKDANEHEKRITEVNTGVYLCSSSELKKRLSQVNNNNAQNEYYLTDIVAGGAEAFLADNSNEFMGVNDRIQLINASKIIWKERVNELMKEGVTFLNPDNVIIDYNVKIGRDSIVYPNAILEGNTVIGRNVKVMQSVHIINSEICDNCVIKDNSYIDNAYVGEGSSVGPMAHLRPHSYLEGDNKVGNFVELKKTRMGIGSKASHLTYLGDARLGSNVNIGCGTITCNYDGFNKYETIIGDNVFVGSDTQFVAPVNIGSGALIGAGSTITKDVPEDALSLSRSEQNIVEDRGREIMNRNRAKKESSK